MTVWLWILWGLVLVFVVGMMAFGLWNIGRPLPPSTRWPHLTDAERLSVQSYREAQLADELNAARKGK
jgi:hypothetical protein